MINTRRLTAPLKLEPAEVRAAIRHLADAGGWLPGVLESDRAFLRSAGVAESAIEVVRRPPPRVRVGGGVTGDVFFRDDGIYYLISGGGERLTEFAVDEYFIEDDERSVEIGGIGVDVAALEATLPQLASNLEDALRATLDGRRVRHMKFEWEPPTVSTTRLGQLRSSEGSEDTPAFEPADLDDDVVRAARALGDPLLREVMREISQAGFARERDIAARWSQRGRKEETAEALRLAREAGLLTTEYLLECRETSEQILRLASADELRTGGHEELVHAPCGRCFRDENLAEGYSLSDLGQRLVQKSNWLTVWITERLVSLGVPVDVILWNLSESGEEVDILLEFLEEVWIFELKDRTFSSGDAHPFNYRRGRYRAGKAFIVTTEKIGEDAKRVFAELTRGTRATPRTRAPGPLYIEGLEAVDPTLQREVALTATEFASRQLQPLTAATGFDLRQLVDKRFAAEKPKRSSRPARQVGSVSTGSASTAA
jgi:hypothetical protein